MIFFGVLFIFQTVVDSNLQFIDGEVDRNLVPLSKSSIQVEAYLTISIHGIRTVNLNLNPENDLI